MTLSKVALSFVLVDFLALTGWVLYRHGLVGWLPDLLQQPVGILAAVDLGLALCLVTAFVLEDARRQGRNPWPFVAITLLTGSAGPLLYLILGRPRAEGAPGEPGRFTQRA